MLNGVNVHVNKKERISIVGETGCGKTTTVNAIAQILARQARIDKGEIHSRKRCADHASERAEKGLAPKNVSIIFQDPIALKPCVHHRPAAQRSHKILRYRRSRR